MFNVEIVRDSIAPHGRRLTTLVATYPRIIHSELMTHRAFARNAASSRAIPWPRMAAAISDNPVVPLGWGAEQSGMQAGDEIPEALRPLARAIWINARDEALRNASMLHHIGDAAFSHSVTSPTSDIGRLLTNNERQAVKDWAASADADTKVRVHKSLPNRITEPWMWITTIITATEWENFYRLRCHPDAEVHFQKIAGMIRDARSQSEPCRMGVGDWHLPFIQPDEEELPLDCLQEASVARCARVSYLTHDGVPSIEKDMSLYERLANGSGFGHWSPHEHVACAEPSLVRSGPFVGWSQFRKLHPQENVEG